MLKTLRERGFKAVVFEAGNDIGGTWRFNCYPGARVDSAVPEYEFSWPEVYNSWNWTTNYVSIWLDTLALVESLRRLTRLLTCM